jgi:hypothetical protein
VTDVPPDLADLLDPSEQLLWFSRPHYRHFRSEAWAAFVFGFVPLIASLCAWFTLFLLLRDLVVGQRFRIANLLGLPIVLLPAIVFGFVAVSALRAPWAVPRRLSRTRYAVTDRRVIVFHGPGYACDDMVPRPHSARYDFTLEQARGRAVKRWRGGRVDVVLQKEEHRGGRGRRSWVDIGILGSVDWQGAVAAIDARSGLAHEVEPGAAANRGRI